jgi:hypothetical protein
VFIKYSWSYSFLKVTPRCIHHRGVDLKGLREVNFSIMGLLSMGRSNHPWLFFLMIVPLKAIASPEDNSKIVKTTLLW